MGVGGNMDEKLINLQIGALLHDIGKIVRRAGKSNKKHSIAGADYLEKEELLDIEKYKEIYDMMYILRRRRKLIF